MKREENPIHSRSLPTITLKHNDNPTDRKMDGRTDGQIDIRTVKQTYHLELILVPGKTTIHTHIHYIQINPTRTTE